MSLLDKASLIVTPNAYEESKLYSVIPNTTLGDMDVVRATTATRVNSAGLIEVVPRNLFTFSEQFENVNWVKSGVTITANTINSPSGTLTADTFNLASTPTAISRSLSVEVVGTNLVCTASIYLKYKDRQFIQLTWGSGFNGTNYVNVDVINGTITQGVYTTANISQLENGWFRVNITTTGASTSPTLYIWAIDNGTASRAANSSGTGGYYIWGAQLDNGSTATEYFPTTTRLNIPRIDYTNGSCPSILVEPQRTNLLLYSNDFSNANWAKVASSTVTTDSGVQNPSGVSPTFRFNASNLAFGGILRQILILTVGQTYTFSYFAKKGNYRYVGIRFNNARNGERFPTYDFDTDTLNKQGATCDLSRTLLTNGWVKLTITFTATIITSNCDIALTTSNGDTSTALSGTEFVYVYGAQTELGTYGTSYIPTVASSVTRNADVISKTGISSLIGQTEGTIFCDVNLNSRVSFTYFAIANNLASATDYLGIAFLNNSIAFESVVAGAVQANISHSNTSTGRFKIAAAYKANDFVLYINGVQIGVDTSGTIPTCSQLGLTAFSQAQTLNYNSAQLYKTRLTNTELQSLTTI